MKELTKRETEIWELIAQGKRNMEIALELGMPESTVKNCCIPLFRKLGVRNRTEAAVKFLAKGIREVSLGVN